MMLDCSASRSIEMQHSYQLLSDGRRLELSNFASLGPGLVFGIQAQVPLDVAK